MKLSDYVVHFLREHGVTKVFGISGGAAVHMFDSIARCPDITYVCSSHEQCAAMEADGYARASGRLGVALTTSGPGATNLLTGTCCSFYDSVPTLMITGQVATHRLKGDRKVRQIGFQETEVVNIFSSVTKYAVQITAPETIRFHLEKAYHLAFEGRPGPVLLDIPDDIQRCEIDPIELEGFDPPQSGDRRVPLIGDALDAALQELSQAKRPLIVLGGGLKTPWVGNVLYECLDKLNIPVATSWAAVDLIWAEHPLRAGPFGVYGPRCGNYCVQNADFILVLGARLSQNLTGGILPSFAREASIAVVDVDIHELNKFEGRGINIKHRINCSLTTFFDELVLRLNSWISPDYLKWKSKIKEWQKVFVPDPSPKKTADRKFIDAYQFLDLLSSVLDKREIVFVDTGGNLTWTCNGLRIKKGQSLHSAWNNTPMGYALPAAIGAACYDPTRPTTCIIGDGGLILCLGELATARKQGVPLKIILFNNHCHGIQKQTLETWLDGSYQAVDPASGIGFPDFAAVAAATGFRTLTIDDEQDALTQLRDAYQVQEPIFINVEINPDQKLYPVLKYGAALENQLPALDSKIIETQMIIEPWREAAPAKNQGEPL
jgi:acetolactate synthase-1/2/3 large subunit